MSHVYAGAILHWNPTGSLSVSTDSLETFGTSNPRGRLVMALHAPVTSTKDVLVLKLMSFSNSEITTKIHTPARRIMYHPLGQTPSFDGKSPFQLIPRTADWDDDVFSYIHVGSVMGIRHQELAIRVQGKVGLSPSSVSDLILGMHDLYNLRHPMLNALRRNSVDTLISLALPAIKENPEKYGLKLILPKGGRSQGAHGGQGDEGGGSGGGAGGGGGGGNKTTPTDKTSTNKHNESAWATVTHGRQWKIGPDIPARRSSRAAVIRDAFWDGDVDDKEILLYEAQRFEFMVEDA